MTRNAVPTWRLLLDAARTFHDDGQSSFRGSDLVKQVQLVDPTRQAGSITPILQGITANASGGTRAACGEVFWRIDRGLYRLIESPTSVPDVESTVAADEPPRVPETGRILLVGCVSKKRPSPAMAKDLYISPLFAKRRAYAEQSGLPWYILSAEYGVIHPNQPISPYDRSLHNESRAYINEWADRVAPIVIASAQAARANVIEVHAGSAYLPSRLRQQLEAADLRIDYPVEGRRIGEHLRWYNQHAR